MVYFEARTLRMHLTNAAAGVAVSLIVAFIGLNLATGCGQSGGACVGIAELTEPAPSQMLAMAAPQSRTVLR